MAMILLKDGNYSKQGESVTSGRVLYQDDIKIILHNGKYKESFNFTDIDELINL